jgi:hypothetical protein
VVGAVHDFNHTAWQAQTFTFTTPASFNGVLRVYRENHERDTAGTAWFDNVAVKQQGDAWRTGDCSRENRDEPRGP